MSFLQKLQQKFSSSKPSTAQIKAEGQSLQDLLAPPAVQVNPTYLQIGEKFSRTIFAATYPRFLSVSWFSPVINMDKVIDISIVIQPS